MKSLYAFRALALTAPFSLASVALADTAGSYAVENPLGNITICGLIVKVLNAAMVIGAPIAVLLVVYAGLKFVMAAGNDKELADAKKNFFWVIVGIAVFFGAGLIARVIIGTLTALGVPSLTSCV